MTRLEPGCFNLVHTGTLLRERDPRPLLRGAAAFIDAGPNRQSQLRLVFVGRVDRAHSALPEWQDLTRRGVLTSLEQRVGHGAAVEMCRAADGLLLIEADAEESPFFPAKLADYLWVRKPVLALSPARSSTTDILGRDYPLVVPPSDSSGISSALERLWTAWGRGALHELVPRPAIAGSVTERAVIDRTEEVFDFLLHRRRTHVA